MTCRTHLLLQPFPVREVGLRSHSLGPCALESHPSRCEVTAGMLHVSSAASLVAMGENVDGTSPRAGQAPAVSPLCPKPTREQPHSTAGWISRWGIHLHSRESLHTSTTSYCCCCWAYALLACQLLNPCRKPRVPSQSRRFLPDTLFR